MMYNLSVPDMLALIGIGVCLMGIVSVIRLQRSREDQESQLVEEYDFSEEFADRAYRAEYQEADEMVKIIIR